jgi:ISXO2-like transposase domain
MNKNNLNFKNLIGFLLEIFPTEQACLDYFEEKRWKRKPVSPFDPSSKVYKCANNRYRCKNTGKYFSVRTGTVFENSKLPLQKWFLAFYLLSSNKKGISSRQLVKYISVTQKSAWFVLHRLRCAFKHPNFKTVLKDFVEIDETFIGGKNKNRHWDKKVPHSQGRSWKDKLPVLGMLEKNGNLVAQVVPNTKQNTIEPIIRENIKKNVNVYTDEWLAYKDLNKWFNHQIVNHSIK